MEAQFTNWVECILLPSHTSEVTARAAINELFTRFGYTKQIFTDQGTNFSNKLFKDQCEVLKISKTRTNSVPASANGQEERFNRTQTSPLGDLYPKLKGIGMKVTHKLPVY